MKNKILTITSDIFANEWAESFLKALMGNVCIIPKDFECVFGGFLFDKFLCSNSYFNCWNTKSITFNLDELSVDWACLYEFKHWITKIDEGEGFSNSGAKRVLNLDYLAKQKGIEIK